MKRNIKLVLSALLMSVCLAGCGSNSNTAESEKKTAELETENAELKEQNGQETSNDDIKPNDYDEYITEQLVRKSLSIPAKATIQISYGEPSYYEGSDTYLVWAQVKGTGEYENYMASGSFEVGSGKLYSVLGWEKSSADDASTTE